MPTLAVETKVLVGTLICIPGFTPPAKRDVKTAVAFDTATANFAIVILQISFSNREIVGPCVYHFLTPQ